VIPFGKYLLLERVSVGGMAEVYKAKAFGVEGFEKILAIKRILPTIAEDEEFIDMFIDEAKIVGQLSHANICQVLELGRIGDSHFIAMEYIWGRDLLQIQNHFRRQKQVMPVPMAVFIISKVCEGLDYAHRKRDAAARPLNIVHRDVSPQNILVAYEGAVKIIDFGIARAAYRQTRTQAGVLKGKFGYMSPEQVRGLPIDRRSDLFAVGTLLYELLTGERLFLGESDFSTLDKVRNARVDPPTKYNSKVSPELEKLVMKALARDPEDRWQWASELQEALQRCLINFKPVFTTQKLSAWMKENFAGQIARDKLKMEEYARIGQEALIEARRQRGPTGKLRASAPAPDSAIAPVVVDRKIVAPQVFSDPMPPVPAVRSPQEPLPGFDVDADFSPPPPTLAWEQAEEFAWLADETEEFDDLPGESTVVSEMDMGSMEDAVADDKRGALPQMPTEGVDEEEDEEEATAIYFVNEEAMNNLPNPDLNMLSPSDPGASGAPLADDLGFEVVEDGPPRDGTGPQPGANRGPIPRANAGPIPGANKDFNVRSTMALTPSTGQPKLNVPGFPPSPGRSPMMGRPPAARIPTAQGVAPTGSTPAAAPPGPARNVPFSAPAPGASPGPAPGPFAGLSAPAASPSPGSPLASGTPVPSPPPVTPTPKPVRPYTPADGAPMPGPTPQAPPNQESAPSGGPKPLSDLFGESISGDGSAVGAAAPLWTESLSATSPAGTAPLPAQPSLAPRRRHWVALVVAASAILLGVVAGVVVFAFFPSLHGGDELDTEPNDPGPAGPLAAGKLFLTVDTAQAQVYVDGAIVPTPATKTGWPLAPNREHQVKISAPAHSPEQFKLNLAPGAEERRTVKLKAATVLSLESTPSGATVAIDGEAKGATPTKVNHLPLGEHKVRFQLDGYEPMERTVELTTTALEAGITVKLHKAAPSREAAPQAATKADRSLRTKTKTKTVRTKRPTKRRGGSRSSGGPVGLLVINTQPWGHVFIDGRNTGRNTPILPNNPLRLSPGPHKLTVRTNSGKSYDFRINIVAGKTKRFVRRLE
jgi:serine/threonine protein kinase